MNHYNFYIKLLQNVVEGLIIKGWIEQGGSEVFRILKNKKGNVIKVFLDNYKRPNTVIVRYSYNKKMEKDK